MRLRFRALIPALFCLTLAPGLAPAGSAELSFNGDSARVIAGWKAAAGRLDIDAGWLHSDDEARGDAVHLGLHLSGSRDRANGGTIDAGVGGRLFGVDLDPSLEAYGVAVGGFARWRTSFAPRLVISGSLYLSPGVLSGGDADNYSEVTVGAGYEVVDGAELFAGFRHVELDLDPGGSAELDDTAHVGIRLSF